MLRDLRQFVDRFHRKPGKDESGQYMLAEGVELREQNAKNLDERTELCDDKKPQWIAGLKICTYAASAVLLLNVMFAIVAFSVSYNRYSPDGFMTLRLFEGSCSTSRNWSIGLHLLINVLGTVIMGASNFCAQFLSAPTREDVDRAHNHGSWIDIGVHSAKNIWGLKGKHKAFWFVLLLTSIPIHTIYNSVILTTKASSEYRVMLAPGDFDGSKQLNINDDFASCFPSAMAKPFANFTSDIADGNFELLTKQQCVDALAVSYVSGQGPLVVLSSDLSFSDESPVMYGGVANPVEGIRELSQYGWMCPGMDSFSCTKGTVQDYLPDWKVGGYPWLSRKFNVTVPWRDGEKKTLQSNNYMSCPAWGDDDLCSDLKTLSNYMLSGVGLDAKQLRTELQDPSNWENRTWAAGVSLQQVDFSCNTPSPIGEANVYGIGGNYSVDGCLSVRLEENCQLLFVPPFLLIVLICTIIKVVCMVLVAHYERVPRLLTVGDAIASFLATPDLCTVGRCLTSKDDWRDGNFFWAKKRHYLQVEALPRQIGKRRRWWEAGSRSLWIVTLFLCLACLAIASYFLQVGISDARLTFSGNDLKSLWALGLGQMNSSTIIAVVKATMVGNVLLANVPQLVVSILYFFYNSLLTSMMVAAEYDRYAVGARHPSVPGKSPINPSKPLRVSGTCQGAQRKSYFLGLPYRYSLPLMTAYTVLHWLVSQSLFYMRINFYDVSRRYVEGADIDACGWSPMAIILAIVVGGVMFLTLFLFGLRRFRSAVPLAGSCSAAISAACHPPSGDRDAGLKGVVWGEVSSFEMVSGSSETGSGSECEGDGRSEEAGVAHCCFTSYDVGSPVLGRDYM